MDSIKLDDLNIKDFISEGFKCYLSKDGFLMVSEVTGIDFTNQIIELEKGYLDYNKVSLKSCYRPKYILDYFSQCYRVYNECGNFMCWLGKTY